ncbi:hypothetical protein [Pseudomonas sp. UBA2684]|uniref:HvfA family oxazolone/thioamide-modified RiPP metallophore n=1 Tax=Pseudomonas sp. UBA2684 TaxID=1947311 RepID=UPI000E9C8C24|nr:hypothetical protein [Pseudomonas sp. UBA2684]HBX56089.1 hypothetical protein [Pseudomonas sp.]|tara:strand:+ start:15496 stop:15789 length:294 start_codon:yes stop_codon:yes gene_type:complete
MKHLNVVVATLGAALLSATAVTAQAAQNPFAAQELSSGYSLAAGEKSAEGACGEGKCGGEMKSEGEGKCGEGKCGGEAKADGEGKCGEGKCGAEKAE